MTPHIIWITRLVHHLFSENDLRNPEYFFFRSDKIFGAPATLSILLVLWWGFQVDLADSFCSPSLRPEIDLLVEFIGRSCERQRGRTLGPLAKGELLPPKAISWTPIQRQLRAHEKLNFPPPNVKPVLHPQRIPVCLNESFLRFTQAVEIPVRRTGRQTGH